jgi:acyl-CoA reductase-like NAD-dependent aldehyde dehydrogenase
MYNQGQVCTATSRILVQEGVYDEFVKQFKEHVKQTSVVGDPFKDDTFQGPQVTKTQFERVLSYIESGKSEGATLVAGGEAFKDVGGKGEQAGCKIPMRLPFQWCFDRSGAIYSPPINTCTDLLFPI